MMTHINFASGEIIQVIVIKNHNSVLVDMYVSDV